MDIDEYALAKACEVYYKAKGKYADMTIRKCVEAYLEQTNKPPGHVLGSPQEFYDAWHGNSNKQSLCGYCRNPLLYPLGEKCFCNKPTQHPKYSDPSLQEIHEAMEPRTQNRDTAPCFCNDPELRKQFVGLEHAPTCANSTKTT